MSFPSGVAISASLCKGLDNPSLKILFSSLFPISTILGAETVEIISELGNAGKLGALSLESHAAQATVSAIIDCTVIYILLSIVVRGPFVGTAEKDVSRFILKTTIINRCQAILHSLVTVADANYMDSI
jgi:undecaprenyl pyrophosphate phosphatase UppP